MIHLAEGIVRDLPVERHIEHGFALVLATLEMVNSLFDEFYLQGLFHRECSLVRERRGERGAALKAAMFLVKRA